MAEDKKAFLQGKMNQDIDDRILPNGEYRSAQNIQVTTSEESDIGSIQNLLGNTKIQTPTEVNNVVSGFKNLDTIGSFFDEKNNRIFYFVTNYSCADHQKKGLLGDTDGPTTALQADNNAGTLFCGIFMYKHNNLNLSVPGTISLLVEGLFLNFSKTHTITGVNLIEELLFFTDGFNQPRKINVEKAINQKATDAVPYYTTEEKISVAKFAPFTSPLLLDYDTTTLNSNVPTVSEPTSSMQTNSSLPDDIMDEKFVRFSYRYRFVDGEYSTIAPFTQVCFIPKTPNLDASHMQKLLKRGQVYFQDENGNADGMVNSVNSVNLNIILPSRTLTTTLDIDGIEVLFKESNNNLIKAVELIEIKNENAKDLVTPSNSSSFQQNEGVFQYKYKSTLPYKTLPANQLPRVYDNVPLSSKAQEIVGNRVVYGNFVQDRLLPVENGITGLNFNSAFDFKFDTTNPIGNADFNNYYVHKEYPFHSIKQRRTYEIGVVLSDKFGRQSPVLTSTVKDSSVSVPAKDENFYSGSWDANGFINAISPGNENFCGDALTVSFNRPIPNAYATATLIPINISATSFVYAFDVYKDLFVTDPLLQGGGGTGTVVGNLYYYSSTGFVTEGLTDFLYLDPSFQTVLTGQTEVYARQGLNSGTANTVSIHKIELNSVTGAVQNISIVNESVFQNALIGPSTPLPIASEGETSNITDGSTAVTPDQSPLANSPLPELGTIYNLTITNFSQINSLQVGDYLKGQNNDFVKIVAIQQQGSIPPFNQGLNVFTDGPASLSYKNYVIDANGNFDFGAREFYTFFKYKITTHGWYSYRIVVKQTEQDYSNVYAPGIYDFEDASYVPILSDNINKVTRDIEFTNTQEVGLSTSKDKLFPKVVPNASNTALSVLSNNDILDVVSIGTSKEQGVKNGNEHVLGFISEPNKNPLLAQIPFGSSVNNNIGSDTAAGLLGTTFQLTTSGTGDSDLTTLRKAGKVLSIPSGVASEFTIGEYLKGASEDLVKIIKITAANPVLIECDGVISTEYRGVFNDETVAKYEFRYGVQENLAVLETKPVESALDIYYETSTSGLVHELNEAVLTSVDFDRIEIVSNFSEGVLYYDDNGVFQNEYAGVVRFFDALDNEISSQDINQVTINSIRGFVETDFNDGVSSIEDTSLDFQETLYNEGDPYPLFEIVLIDSEWKIKPTQNFVHAVDNGHANAFEFTVSLNHQQTTSQEVNITNQVFILSLENVAPAVEANITLIATVETSEGSGVNLIFGNSENDRVLGKVDARNGCADLNFNDIGLLYFPKNFNPSSGLSGVTLDNGEVVPASTVLFDTNQDIIQEIELDNETGEIKIRDDFSELFHGVLNKTFEIDVYDSDVLDFDSLEYNFDNQGVFFGKKSTTTVNVQITADLIIIDLEQGNYDHPYYRNTGQEQLNFIKIWEQVAPGEDNTKNMHWSEGTGSDAFTDPGLNSSNSGHLFICSYYDWAGSNPHRGEAWGIKIDEETGEPVVNRFVRELDGVQSPGSNFFFFSTSNPFKDEGPTDTKSYLNRSNTGIMRINEESLGHVNFLELKLRGIAGSLENVLSTSGENSQYTGEGFFEDPSSELNMQERFENNLTQFDFGRAGSTSSSYNDLPGNRTVGAYVYYNIEGGISGSVGHPDQRLTLSSQGYNGLGSNLPYRINYPLTGQKVTHMFDVPHTINVLNSYEYKIFYEVERKKAPGSMGDDHFMCKRVFLARKGDNTGNSTAGIPNPDLDDLFF